MRIVSVFNILIELTLLYCQLGDHVVICAGVLVGDGVKIGSCESTPSFPTPLPPPCYCSG